MNILYAQNSFKIFFQMTTRWQKFETQSKTDQKFQILARLLWRALWKKLILKIGGSGGRSPPENFWNLRSEMCHFLHFFSQSERIQIIGTMIFANVCIQNPKIMALQFFGKVLIQNLKLLALRFSDLSLNGYLLAHLFQFSGSMKYHN